MIAAPIGAMLAGAAAAWIAAMLLFGAAIGRDVALGMAAPLAAVTASWALVVRAHRRDPAAITGVMLQGFAGKVIFVENYEIDLARTLVQGVDVWLNNPTRMLEASGTSGMKASANGALNLSIGDGWWPEAADGTNGWPVYAPFDAILVAAGGPEIPQPLLDQLEIGGRLVIPVGAGQKNQELIRVTRSENGFREEACGPCAFVPLIGEHGWHGRI